MNNLKETNVKNKYFITNQVVESYKVHLKENKEKIGRFIDKLAIIKTPIPKNIGIYFDRRDKNITKCNQSIYR